MVLRVTEVSVVFVLVCFIILSFENFGVMLLFLS